MGRLHAREDRDVSKVVAKGIPESILARGFPTLFLVHHISLYIYENREMTQKA